MKITFKQVSLFFVTIGFMAMLTSFTFAKDSTDGARWGFIIDGPSNVREKPNAKAKIVYVYESNERVKIYGTTQNGWYIIKVKGITAYIHHSQIQLESEN